jgi:hypothetical protein
MGWMSVDSIGATLQQDGTPDMAEGDAEECEVLACSCDMQQAWPCDPNG